MIYDDDEKDIDQGDLMDYAWDNRQQQDMLDDVEREATTFWAIEQRDADGGWWRSGDRYATKQEADGKIAWMDCPARAVKVVE